MTKGDTQKKQRIMGRGRTGVSRIRKTHVTVKVAQINFSELIAKAPTDAEREQWAKRMDVVKRIKAMRMGNGPTAQSSVANDASASASATTTTTPTTPSN